MRGSTPLPGTMHSRRVIAIQYEKSLIMCPQTRLRCHFDSVPALPQVKRAPTVPKLKKFVKDRVATYELDEVTGILSLK